MGHMKWELYTKIIDDYSHLMNKFAFDGKLTYCNMGEPFIEKNIANWVKYAIDRGINVYFNTNAALLTPEIIDSLVDAGFQGYFNISCHGITPHVFEYTSGGLDLGTVLKNVDYLLQKYPSQHISVNAVPYKWPSDEESKLRDFWTKKGIAVGVNEG